MKAIRIHTYSNDPKQLLYEDAPILDASDEEVLVQVRAAGITPTELFWRGIWKNIEEHRNWHRQTFITNTRP